MATSTFLASPSEPDSLEIAPTSHSILNDIRLALRDSRASLVGLSLLILLILSAVLAPVLSPYNPTSIVGASFGQPSSLHLLGLDDGGHDVLSLLLWGLRLSLIVGFGATAISVLIGASIGLVSGFFGGLTDVVLMRFTDFILVIPMLPLMIVVADIWGSSTFHLVVIIGVIAWPMTALVIRSQTRSVCKRTYVRRATALGARSGSIIVRHVMPHLLPLVVANAVLLVGSAIFIETALAFLGLADPSQASLGTMIEFAFLRSATSVGAWWAIVPPGVVVALIVAATSLVGRAIEDGLNPRMKVAHLSSRTYRVLAIRARD